jgi:hypothetical protein
MTTQAYDAALFATYYYFYNYTDVPCLNVSAPNGYGYYQIPVAQCTSGATNEPVDDSKCVDAEIAQDSIYYQCIRMC